LDDGDDDGVKEEEKARRHRESLENSRGEDTFEMHRPECLYTCEPLVHYKRPSKTIASKGKRRRRLEEHDRGRNLRDEKKTYRGGAYRERRHGMKCET
jgi:hypothetical protein